MTRFLPRPLPLALALAPLLVASLVLPPGSALAQNAAAQAALLQIDQPAQPLGDALNAWARHTRTQMAVQPSLVAGKRAPALSGQFTPRQALERLLAGSGLLADLQDGEAIIRRAPTPASPASSGETALPAVTVTAQADGSTTEGTGSYALRTTAAATGLALSARDTPQSVSVLTRQQLDDQNLLTLGEAIRNVTGVSASSSDSDRTDVYSRGFYVDNYQYDGVPVITANDFFGASTFDSTLYDRVEVVRGATGLMTGAGNPGASVNLVRKRASSKEFTGTASLGLGSWAHHRGVLDLSSPLSSDGRVRARVSAMAEERDSHLDRYHTRNQAVLATVEADLTPDTNLRAGLERQAKRPTGVTWGGFPMVFSDGTPAHWSRTASIGTDWTYWNTTNTTAFAALEHRFEGGWSARAHLSRLESDYESRLLYLLGQPDRVSGQGLGAFPNYSRQELSQNTASLQATGPFEWLGRRHEAVVGLTTSKSRYRYGNHAYGTPAAIGDLRQWDGSYPEPAWGAFRAFGDDRTEQSAVYGALRLDLGAASRLIVGGRQNHWKTQGLAQTRSHDVFTPYAGLVHDIGAGYSAYASYTDIFQPQNYRSANGSYLDPVQGKSYEAGLKGEHLGGRLNTSFAVFRIDQDNVAERDGAHLIEGSTEFAYRGAKGVRSKGFEMQAAGEIASGWQVSAGLARTLATKADGARLNPQKPRNQAHLSTSYRLRGDWSRLTVGAGLQWTSATHTTLTTSQGISATRAQGSVAVASLMAHYAITPQLSAQLNISNLFDKTYFDLASDGLMYYGAPRKAMLNLKYLF